LSTYWPRLSTHHHGFIDWSWSAADLERFICAFDDPYAGASTYWNGQRVRLKRVFSDAGLTFHPFQSGIVYRKTADTLWVAASGGGLALQSVSNDDDGLDCRAKVRLGDRFSTPAAVLEQAQEFRAIFLPSGLKA
jgi:methionyl-tRNA formyltransferase